MSVKLLNTIKSVDTFLKNNIDKKIGLVPTMGALHDGHFSLVKKAKKECDIVVVSIFVNPTQFGKNEDLSKYPRTLKEDKAALNKLGVDAIFFPSEEIMYGSGYSTYVTVEGISNILCGLTRPTHFKGVTTVVTKLFNIVHPNFAYFGDKDFQQSVVIKKMVRELNIPVVVKTLPIIREQSGLALSSRNKYLNERELKDAPLIYKALKKAKEEYKNGTTSSKELISLIKEVISKGITLKIDYVEVVDSYTLIKVETVTKHSRILIACYCGATRLIDNIAL